MPSYDIHDDSWAVLDILSPKDDCYQWRNAVDESPSPFSASKLFRSLYPDPPQVPWFKAVWFKKRIPKHAFIMWPEAKDHHSTHISGSYLLYTEGKEFKTIFKHLQACVNDRQRHLSAMTCITLFPGQ
ncbi:hypothetical protein YC2023_083727 [Brassica napus]